MPQVSATISNETYEEIKKIALKDRRSVSSTVEILLDRIIKERNRKSKASAQ